MKKFNEWMSFRSNSYNEAENDQQDAEGTSAFDFSNIPGTKNTSTVKRPEERLSKLTTMYGVRDKIRLLSDVIKDIYDFSNPEEMDKIKKDLRYLSNHLEENNNLDIPATEQE
jgi:hypothetical protein